MVAWRLLRVDGGSEVEVGEKRDRHDDAPNVTRPAVEVGILPGGRVDLLKASHVLSTNTPGMSNLPTNADAEPVPTANSDQEMGSEHHPSSPHAPRAHDPGEELLSGPSVAQYGAPDKFAWGCNSQNRDKSILIAGMIDLLKVVGTALDLSGFGSLLTTGEVCVVGTPMGDKPVDCSGMNGGMGGF